MLCHTTVSQLAGKGQGIQGVLGRSKFLKSFNIMLKPKLGMRSTEQGVAEYHWEERGKRDETR
jgi:hypothetical protein